MIAFLSNAFNDPSDPWYYVVGTLFLLLIFGALAVYVIFSNKKKKKDGGNGTDNAKSPVTDTPIEEKAEEKTENNTANNTESAQSDEQPTDDEEQGEFTVVLTEVGRDKVAVIKAIREYNRLGLVELKKLVENLPATVKENVAEAKAEEIANMLREVGATVEIK